MRDRTRATPYCRRRFRILSRLYQGKSSVVTRGYSNSRGGFFAAIPESTVLRRPRRTATRGWSSARRSALRDRLKRFGPLRCPDVGGRYSDCFLLGTTGLPGRGIFSTIALQPSATQASPGINKDDITLSVPSWSLATATGTNLLFRSRLAAQPPFSERSTRPEMFEMIIVQDRPCCERATISTRASVEDARTRYDLSSLRFLFRLAKRFRPNCTTLMEKFGVEILDGIGSAEMFHIY